MKTTIAMAALALMLSAPAYAQDNDGVRPGRPDRERQFRGPGGTQFRGGDMDRGEGGQYGRRSQGRRGSRDGDVVRSGRRGHSCPNCGAPQRKGQGQGFNRGGQSQGMGMGPGAQGRGQRSGPRFEGMDRPPGPPPGQWGRGERQGPGSQGQPGFGPRGRGVGRPEWDDDDRPAGPRGPGSGGWDR